MSKKKIYSASQDDLILWAEITRTVNPLTSDLENQFFIQDSNDEYVNKNREAKAIEPYPSPRQDKVHKKSETSKKHTALDIGQFNGIDKRTTERFRLGKMMIDGTIDLHGMTQREAHHYLIDFIQRHINYKSRCLIIITGKGNQGEGVLRKMVPLWLNDPNIRSKILSFTYAQHKHGGSGALYVLLKRDRERII